MQTQQFRINCQRCNGKGYTVCESHCDADVYDGCAACGGEGGGYSLRDVKNGQGYVNVRFVVLDAPCNRCDGQGKLHRTSVEYGTGFFGEYRKERKGSEKCHRCLGGGKQLNIINKNECDSCRGSGKEYFWTKGFFNTEYKRSKTCKKCSGSGVIDEVSNRIYDGTLRYGLGKY